jgi:hypothetical protein
MRSTIHVNPGLNKLVFAAPLFAHYVAGDSVAIFFLNPIFSALLAWPVLGERVGGVEAAAIVCGRETEGRGGRGCVCSTGWGVLRFSLSHTQISLTRGYFIEPLRFPAVLTLLTSI